MGSISLNLYGISENNSTNNTIRTSQTEIKVVATTHILRDFAQEIIGDEGVVSVIIESGSCPGHYDYPPSDINLVESADIVFYHGFEGSGLSALLAAAGNEDAAFGMIQNTSIGWGDQWGSPDIAPKFVNAICSHLNDTYPLLNETFNDNRDAYLAKLEGYKTYYEMKINTTYKWNNAHAYVMKHQEDFMNWLGFNISGYDVWITDDNAITPTEIADVTNGADQHDAVIMVGNCHSGTDIGKAIADALSIDSAFLINFPGIYGVDTYLEQIEFNVALLHHVLNGGPDPRTYAADTSSIGIDLIIPLIIFIFACISLIIYKKRELIFQRNKNIKI